MLNTSAGVSSQTGGSKRTGGMPFTAAYLLRILSTARAGTVFWHR